MYMCSELKLVYVLLAIKERERREAQKRPPGGGLERRRSGGWPLKEVVVTMEDKTEEATMR